MPATNPTPSSDWHDLLLFVLDGPFKWVCVASLPLYAAWLLLCYRRSGGSFTDWACWLPIRTARSMVLPGLRELFGDRIAWAVAQHTLRRARVAGAVAVVGFGGAAAIGVTWMGGPVGKAAVVITAIGVVLAICGVVGSMLEDREAEISNCLFRPDMTSHPVGLRLLEQHWQWVPAELLSSPVHRSALTQALMRDVAADALDAAVALADGWDGTLGDLLEVAEAVATADVMSA